VIRREEFVVVLPGIDLADATVVGERIRRTVEIEAVRAATAAML
jgi:GGDEF domain-containing protein